MSLVVALGLLGCAGDDDDAPAEAPPPAATPTPTPTPEPEPEPEEEAAAEAQTYVVESGDTLSGIAQRFGTTVDALVEANGIDDPDQLAIGDELVVPAGD